MPSGNSSTHAFINSSMYKLQRENVMENRQAPDSSGDHTLPNGQHLGPTGLESHQISAPTQQSLETNIQFYIYNN